MTSGLRCPGCDVVADSDARVSIFADRGWAEDGRPVLRCGNCGCGFVLRSGGLVRKRMRGQLIEPDLWSRMEQIWERNNPLPATAAPAIPDASELARQLAATEAPTPHLVHQLAEAAELSEEEALRLLIDARATARD
jgi:hypothetical protein